MTCETMRELILVYADCPDEIDDPNLKNEYLCHLNECEACCTFQKEMTETITLVKEHAPEVPLKDGKTITDSVLDTLNNPPKVLHPKKRFFPSHFGTIAAAIIVAVVFAVANNNTFRTLFDRTFLNTQNDMKRNSEKIAKDVQLYGNDNAAFVAPSYGAESKSDTANGTEENVSAPVLPDNSKGTATETPKEKIIPPKSGSGTGAAPKVSDNGSNTTKPTVPKAKTETGQSTSEKTGQSTESPSVSPQPSPKNTTEPGTSTKTTETTNPLPTEPVDPPVSAEPDSSSGPSNRMVKMPPSTTDNQEPGMKPEDNDVSVRKASTDNDKQIFAKGVTMDSLPSDGNTDTQFYEFVQKCNDKAAASCTVHNKDYHTIPFDLASSVSFDDFKNWYSSIQNTETEYTVDNFKKHFQST